MVIYWKRLFCGMHCFMISICDTSLNLMMEQTKVPLTHTKYKLTASNTAITEKKEKK